MPSTARLTAFFADVDAMVLAMPSRAAKISHVKHRIANNQRCKDYLVEWTAGRFSGRKAPNYDAFDLSEIEDGLLTRLAAVEADEADAALTAASHERGADVARRVGRAEAA